MDNIDKTIDQIKHHIAVLNHSSERMADSLDELENDVSNLRERVSSIESNLEWMKMLNVAILGAVLSLVFKVFAA
tara:strand:- start:156 stop:380 length:225 start_codon:yes stop_codon:yes gene_type:complete